jgi:hypothetical protein
MVLKTVSTLGATGGGGGGGVSSVTATSPLASSGGTTPDISLTGIISVAKGGTGVATIPTGNVVIGNGTSALYGVAPGTSGNVLTSIGGVWTSNAAVGTAGGPILESYQTISSNYTITSGSNGFSVGPVTIATGVSVTVPTGQAWLIAA